MRRHTSRALLAGGAILALAAGLVGCSPSGSPSDGVTLTFWDHSGNPARAETYRALIAEFEEAHEGISVEFLTLPSDSAFEKIQTSLASNQAPDIASLSGTFVAPLTGQDALLDIESRYDSSVLSEQLDPSLVENMRKDARDGGLYALPYTLTYGTLWYRTDLWAEAGRAAGPTSWSEFYDGTAELTAPSQNQYGFAMRGGAGGVFQFMQAMYAQSGIEELFDSRGVSTIDDPANLAAFTDYVGLYKTATSEADLGFGYPDMVAAFDSGAAATMQHNLGSYGEHAAALQDNFAGVPLPAANSGKRAVVVDPVPSFTVFKQSKHPDEAWKLVEFLLGEKGNGALNETIGQIPSNLASRSASWLADSQHVSAATEWLDSEETVLMSAPTYLADYGTIMRNELEPELQRVLLGQLAPEDFLAKWAALLTEAQQQHEERGR